MKRIIGSACSPLILSLLLFAAAALLLGSAGESPRAPEAMRSLVLPAHGGVKVDVPSWTVENQTTDSALLRPAKDSAPAKVEEVSITVVVEAGPKDPTKVEWQAVRKAIEASSRDSGSPLTLAVANAWQQTDGFLGRVMKGQVRRGRATLEVELVALAGPNVFVTIALLSSQADAALSDLVAVTARSVSRVSGR